MQRITQISSVLFLTTLLFAPTSFAQIPSLDVQITAAVTALPESMRADAAVMGYDEAGMMTTLREGSNRMICIGDNPADDRFHVACYDKSLDAFMSRGRALSKEGKGRMESREIRKAEIEAGELEFPDGPAALYQLFGGPNSLNAETGEVSEVNPLYVVYVPYATTESTGIGEDAPMPGAPWLMDPGLPWAHIMYSPSR